VSFEEWWAGQHIPDGVDDVDGIERLVVKAWTAATDAERERIAAAVQKMEWPCNCTSLRSPCEGCIRNKAVAAIAANIRKGN